MKKIIEKTKGAFAPLMLIALLSSQGFAQSEVVEHVDNNKTIENNQTVEWYGGLGFSSVKAVCIDNCEDITFGVIGKVGYDFNQYIGVEGRIIKTMWEYEQQKVEHMGLFAKPMLPINEGFHVYGLLGYGKTKTGDKKEFDESGIAWGLGVNYYFDDNKEELVELQEQLKTLQEAEQKELGNTEEKNVRAENIQKLQKKIEEFDNEQKLGLFLDYERLLQKSDSPDLDAINFGVSYNF